MTRTLPLRWLVDNRTRRAAELLTVLWVLAIADLIFTLWADLYTPFHELNPWADALISDHRLLALAAVKVLLTAAGSAILWVLRRHAVARTALWVVVLAYVALLFRWSDYTSQILALGIVTL